MTLKNNDITLAIAVLMIVIIGWTSRGNLVNHSRERVTEELSVNELDTITRCAVRVDTSLLGLTIYFPATDSIVLRCFMYSGGYPFSVPVIPVHFLGVKTDYLLRS